MTRKCRELEREIGIGEIFNEEGKDRVYTEEIRKKERGKSKMK